MYASKFALKDASVSGHIHHLVHLIKVRLEGSLAVGQPLSHTGFPLPGVLSSHPELGQLTHGLQVSYGDLIAVDELVLLEEIGVQQLHTSFRNLLQFLDFFLVRWLTKHTRQDSLQHRQKLQQTLRASHPSHCK